jgi:hypothetical protein
VSRPRFQSGVSLMQIAAAVVGSASASQVVDPPVYTHKHGDRLCAEVPCARNDADGHTYRTSAEPGVSSDVSQIDIVGANGRRLIARWTPEGVYVGGCLISDADHADALASFITREDPS